MDQDHHVSNSTALVDRPEPLHANLWQIARRRTARLALGVVAGLALAFGYHALTGPWYESTAQLRIHKMLLRSAPITGQDQPQTPEDYLASYTLIITSPEVVGEAVRKYNLASLGCFQKKEGMVKNITSFIYSLSRYVVGPARNRQPEDILTKDIIDHLVVTRDSPKPGISPANDVLILSFRGTVPQDCDAVLTAIIASFKDFLKVTDQDINAEIRDTIMTARDMLQTDLKKSMREYDEFRRKIDPLWKSDKGSTVQEELFDINKQRSTLRMRLAEIKVTVDRVERAIEEGRSQAELLEIMSGLPTNREMITPTLLPNQDFLTLGRSPRLTLEEQFINLWLEELRLEQTVGSQSTETQKIRRQMQAVRALLMPSSVPAAKDPELAALIQDLVELKIHLLREEFKQKKEINDSLGKDFDSLQAKAKQAQLNAIQDEWYQYEIGQRKLLFENIFKRLQEIESVRDYGGYKTELLARPESEVAIKKYLLVLGLGLFCGLLVGFGWGYRAELADKSFRTQEISRRLGLPVMGHIPLLRTGKGTFRTARSNGLSLDPLLCTYYRPNSRDAEAYRAVRTFLHFSSRAGGRKIIQIASPAPADGKTLLASNLAISVAQAGKKVLLVDADLRRPRLHKVFALSNQIGLTTLLGGQTGQAEALQHTAVPGLSVLPSGPLPANPAELLASPRFHELLQAMREQFDLVLVDSSPLLAVTDASVMAPQVDGILLSLRLSKKARPQAERAKELLDALGAEVLGVVVNGMGRQWRSRGYGYDPQGTVVRDAGQ